MTNICGYAQKYSHKYFLGSISPEAQLHKISLGCEVLLPHLMSNSLQGLWQTRLLILKDNSQYMPKQTFSLNINFLHFALAR
jgi:hypothetical protein